MEIYWEELEKDYFLTENGTKVVFDKQQGSLSDYFNYIIQKSYYPKSVAVAVICCTGIDEEPSSCFITRMGKVLISDSNFEFELNALIQKAVQYIKSNGKPNGNLSSVRDV